MIKATVVKLLSTREKQKGDQQGYTFDSLGSHSVVVVPVLETGKTAYIYKLVTLVEGSGQHQN